MLLVTLAKSLKDFGIFLSINYLRFVKVFKTRKIKVPKIQILSHYVN